MLVGGGTTKVGDPSGKDASRQLLDDKAIQANLDGISSVFKKFLTFGDGPTDAVTSAIHSTHGLTSAATLRAHLEPLRSTTR